MFTVCLHEFVYSLECVKSFEFLHTVAVRAVIAPPWATRGGYASRGAGGVSRLSSRKIEKEKFSKEIHEKVLTFIRVCAIMITTNRRRLQNERQEHSERDHEVERPQ